MEHGAGASEETIGHLLRLLRLHLGLDVAFVSEVDECCRVLRYVDSDLVSSPVAVGDADPADQSYCRWIIDGELPEFLADPAAHPLSAGLPATEQLPVGTHLGVPIRLSDGTAYGTLCSFALQVRDGLDERDVAVMRLVADVIAGYIEEREGHRRQHVQRRRRLQAITADDEFQMVFQPVIDLSDRTVVGVEALTRFPSFAEGPASVFDDAWRHGVGVDLELAVIRAALARLPRLSEDAYLSVNVSPATLTSPEFIGALEGVACERVVIEVTEHSAVTDYEALLHALQPLSDCGVRLAIDDLGTGFSGLQQILRLQPDIIKLDAELVRDLPAYPGKQAMIAALTTFATRMNTILVAEGIETAEELEAVRVLGVSQGQGYHTGPPTTRPDKPASLPALASTRQTAFS